ncbi:dioxygenase family protein [Bacillus salipaludis]|uniref:dioxygenase family protein n=1 Tax=Bacillus salipaludis TaxID=2547811 RepID=UPI003555D6BA
MGKRGPVGELLKSIGRHSWRPAHIHFKISYEGFEITCRIHYVALHVCVFFNLRGLSLKNRVQIFLFNKRLVENRILDTYIHLRARKKPPWMNGFFKFITLN